VAAKKKTPENVALARRLRLEGKQYKEIARLFGVCRQAIFFWCLDEDELRAKTLVQNKKRSRASLILHAGKRNARQRGYAPPDITQADLTSLLDSHNGKCEICGTAERRLHLDHCHKTGRVRGLLCTLCNTGIGALKESVQVLRSAIEYIEKR
jgi:Recombination endonuclease VII